MLRQSPELTFKDNKSQARHGWLRLTPAYSVKLVSQILAEQPEIRRVLDPFSGSGTTGLVAIERGLEATLVDINPFLLWFVRAKTANYPEVVLTQAIDAANCIIVQAIAMQDKEDLWRPPISNIHRWWTPSRLENLVRIYYQLNLVLPQISPIKDLLLVAFCRCVMNWSNAAFNHQSMSFKDTPSDNADESKKIYQNFQTIVLEIVKEASDELKGNLAIFQADSRVLDINTEPFDCVISSPPYSNRMSYIRELRPYMYWLAYLKEARDAGELDWQAIGGTWGIATSRLNTWQAEGIYRSQSLETIVSKIAHESSTLANYVHKYIEDMYRHFSSLAPLLNHGARIFYVVGNSKFYETVVPIQDFYADILNQLGFHHILIKPIRKRNSKKELYEYIVSATKP